MNLRGGTEIRRLIFNDTVSEGTETQNVKNAERRRPTMSKQGCALPEVQVRKIQSLLYTTNMSLPEIAQRIGCSRSTVVTINRKFQIRNYGGSRSKWDLTPPFKTEQSAG